MQKLILLFTLLVSSLISVGQQKYELRVKEVHQFDSSVDLAGGCLVHPCWNVDGTPQMMYLGSDGRKVYILDTLWIIPLPELYGQIPKSQVRNVYFYLFDGKVKTDSAKVWLQVDWKTAYMLADNKFRAKYEKQHTSGL
jgi:hypothetical protein